MPVKGRSKKATMKIEMNKFEEGKLHSGSKKGPVVKNRKQAVAIALEESRLSNKKKTKKRKNTKRKVRKSSKKRVVRSRKKK